MDILGIEAFLAIVNTRNLTKAAELLNLSQSAVSHRLKVLEQEMGATLIERRKGIQNINLTPFGENFVVLAERWNVLNQEIKVLQESGPQMTLSIGAADSINMGILPPLYRAISQHSPAIRLQIRSQTTMDSYRSIERREMDVAFVKMGRVEPNITVEPFFEDEMVLVRLTTKDSREEERVSPAELDCRYEIYMNWGPSYQMWHDRWWDAYGSAPIHVDTAGLIFSLITEPRQWAMIPKSIASTFGHLGKFSFQQLSDPPPSRVCYKIMHRHTDPGKSLALEILNQYIRATYRHCSQHP